MFKVEVQYVGVVEFDVEDDDVKSFNQITTRPDDWVERFNEGEIDAASMQMITVLDFSVYTTRA